MLNKIPSSEYIYRQFDIIFAKFNQIKCQIDKLFERIPINIGTGIGIYKRLFNNKFEFKSLLAGSNTTITETNNEIIISSTATPVTCEDIDDCLGISDAGAINKFLNEQGDFVTVSGSGFTCADLIGCNVSNLTNDAGYITSAALAPYLTSATAAATYYPLTNPSNYIALTALSAGTGINYNNLTGVITNSSPDQVVSLTQGGTTTITGTYPNFTISSADQFTGTVTSVSALTIGTTGTDLNSTVANSTTTPVITLNVPTASATNRGALSSTDWTTFNNKQNALTNPVTGIGTNNEIAAFNSTGSTITSLSTTTYPSLTELSYVKGVTSAIQTQIDSKAGNTVYVTGSNVTTTSNIASNITGLSISLEANSTYNISGYLAIACNNTGGLFFGFATISGSTLDVRFLGTTGATTFIRPILTATGVLTGNAIGTQNSSSNFTFFEGFIQTTTAGTLQMQFASAVNTQLSTIFANASYLKVVKL